VPLTPNRLTTQSPSAIANDAIEIRTTLRCWSGVSGI